MSNGAGNFLQRAAGWDSPSTSDAGKYLLADGTWATPGIAAAWPVGSIFLSTVATNPATLLGFGTWVALAPGRVFVSFDATQTEFDTLRKTGGEKTHQLTATEMPSHTHVQPSHTHPSIQVQGNTTAAITGTHIMTSTTTGGSSRAATAPELANAATATNNNTGGDGTHNNLQPFYTIQAWERTT